MAAYSNRMSTYSNAGNRSGNATTQQVSTTTLLNALHNSYASGQAYPLEISTSLVVNTWVNARDVGPDGRYGGTVDTELGRRAWEHARRRAEDGCIILGSALLPFWICKSDQCTDHFADLYMNQHPLCSHLLHLAFLSLFRRRFILL